MAFSKEEMSKLRELRANSVAMSKKLELLLPPKPDNISNAMLIKINKLYFLIDTTQRRLKRKRKQLAKLEKLQSSSTFKRGNDDDANTDCIDKIPFQLQKDPSEERFESGYSLMPVPDYENVFSDPKTMFCKYSTKEQEELKSEKYRTIMDMARTMNLLQAQIKTLELPRKLNLLRAEIETLEHDLQVAISKYKKLKGKLQRDPKNRVTNSSSASSITKYARRIGRFFSSMKI
ncbi:filament-like plant protein 4 [Quillaja saponaria]|uniref:Filament-like plant protein 4 n=1 Tax=Quillaja saponaria TaxID=32244 RepID=A0AAD7PJW0_QUISA|nr:filament-like plant protein 4 [Quillaja saponaria]